jgi:hypothetical protein
MAWKNGRIGYLKRFTLVRRGERCQDFFGFFSPSRGNYLGEKL